MHRCIVSLRQHSSQLREVTAILPPFSFFLYFLQGLVLQGARHEALWLCFLGSLQQGLQTHQHQIPFELA